MSLRENKGNRASSRSRSRSPFDRRNLGQPSTHRPQQPQQPSILAPTSAPIPSLNRPRDASGLRKAQPPLRLDLTEDDLTEEEEETPALDLPSIPARAIDPDPQAPSPPPPVNVPTLATIGIISIGEMGLGIAKLLTAHNYRVFTNLNGRSRATRARASEGKITIFNTDDRLIQECDYIFSIVPPREAYSNARRISLAMRADARLRAGAAAPLYFIDLNATSPRTARTICDLFIGLPVVFIDAGIIGGPPRPPPKNSVASISSFSSNNSYSTSDDSSGWKKPSIPMSGPRKLCQAPTSGAHLADLLNTRHISDIVGQASGLKMCFASTTKGLYAILIQSFTTASSLGILTELKSEMRSMNPSVLEIAEKGLPSVPPKAYRWVREMEEIADTFAEEGGFEPELFEGVAKVYKTMSEDTVLGDERAGDRARGQTLDDVAQAMREGLFISQRDGSADRNGNGGGKNHIEG